jgi:hypothetical protein
VSRFEVSHYTRSQNHLGSQASSPALQSTDDEISSHRRVAHALSTARLPALPPLRATDRPPARTAEACAHSTMLRDAIEPKATRAHDPRSRTNQRASNRAVRGLT